MRGHHQSQKLWGWTGMKSLVFVKTVSIWTNFKQTGLVLKQTEQTYGMND